MSSYSQAEIRQMAGDTGADVDVLPNPHHNHELCPLLKERGRVGVVDRSRLGDQATLRVVLTCARPTGPCYCVRLFSRNSTYVPCVRFIPPTAFS
jgi:hypothetical protein